MRGVYFFPGEAGGNLHLYTTHPLLADDQHWNSDVSSRARVIDRITATHANTVVMSYWSNMPQWSPMELDCTSVNGVLDEAQRRGLVVLPVIEGGFDKDHPEIPHWEFSKDFPSPAPGGPTAPGLIERIRELVTIFEGRMDLWARLYDRDDTPRYAVQILHVCSELPGTTDASFAQAFADVALQVESPSTDDAFAVGFLLDIIGSAVPYVATPATAGPLLAAQPSVLAVSGFESEVFSGEVLTGPKGGAPIDNNASNLGNLADWKRAAIGDWAASGLPVILDVSNGFDGRFIWKDSDGGVGFWGDNLEYTDDRWRNWMSELKGPQISGITFDTWNGYTEGYAAVPSFEHYYTVYNWLTDLFEPDPRDFSHMHYVDGTPTYRVYGAICSKWIALGADRGFGAPTTDEMASGRGRVSFFTDGGAAKAVYWSAATGAHEIHGLIAKTYWEETGGACGRLGLPVSDQEPTLSGHVSRFEHGRIDWTPGDALGRITYS